jgi:hypothetical protein
VPFARSPPATQGLKKVAPEVGLDHVELITDFEDLLRPSLDILWQSFGQRRCQFYDEKGNWRGTLEHALRNTLESELGTLNLVKATFGPRSGDRSYHADFELLCGAHERGDHDQHTG